MEGYQNTPFKWQNFITTIISGKAPNTLQAYNSVPLPRRRRVPLIIINIRFFCTAGINSMALNPQANYTDWATATCRGNLVPTYVDSGVSRGQRGGSPTVVSLSFLDRVLLG
jgi:hypothetical protein